MRLPNPLLLAALYGLSELYLAFTRHSRTQAVSRDRSLLLLWTVIIASLCLGIQMIWLFPKAVLPYPRGFYFLGFILFLAGLALRWYSIGYLGRYFTVNVSISLRINTFYPRFAFVISEFRLFVCLFYVCFII